MTIAETDLKLLLKALAFAAHKHKDQRRKAQKLGSTQNAVFANIRNPKFWLREIKFAADCLIPQATPAVQMFGQAISLLSAGIKKLIARKPEKTFLNLHSAL